jgi:hypothetical protein
MKKKIVFILLTAACLLPTATRAQESMGIANSNYAPTQSVHLNPSSIVDSKLWLDVHLVGMGAYMYNDYFYFPQASVWTRPFPEGTDRYVLGNLYRGDVNVDVWGPAFTLSLGKHAIGLHTAVRSYTDATRVDAPIAKFIFEGLSYVPQHGTLYHAEDMKATSLTWGEIGINYATFLKRRQKDLWTAGITAKYLSGINAIALDIATIDYEVVNDSDLFVSPISGKYGLVEPGFGAGQGWSIDLGFTFKKMLDDVDSYVPHTSMSDCSTKDYRYKLGISLMDVGNIKFNKGAVFQQYNNTDAYWSRFDTASFTDLGSTDQNLNSNINNGAVQNVRGTDFTTWLPSYASLQFDYNFGKHFFANLTAIQGFRIQAPFGVHRRSTIALTPRYERKRWEVAIPVSLHDFRKVQPGLMLRLNNLIIGTDNLIPLLAKSDMNAADIYFHLKIPIVKSPYCGGKKHKKGKNGKSGKKGREDSCPAYM